MKRFVPTLFLAGALLTAPLLSAAIAGGHYIQPEMVDLKAVLPAPPALGSLAAEADMETIRQVQAARTPADVAWAKSVEKDNFLNCSSVLGPWFTKENLPYTTEFLQQLSDDLAALSRGYKDWYPRARPPRAGPGVEPCVEVPETGSYPSGHSTRAYFWAAVLGEVFPEQQAALAERARRVAWGRVIGGVHFPSDTIGGRLVAAAVVEVLRKNPAYRTAVEKCRAEAAPFLLKKAA